MPWKEMETVDRFVLTDLSGMGLELALNGQCERTPAGGAVLPAYCAMWLGPDLINEALKVV